MNVLALDADVLGLSFVRGMVASINPCGFVLLPTYLVSFLAAGAAGHAPDGRADGPAGLRRALAVSAAVSSGFMTVFLIAGYVTNELTRWFAERAYYATAAIAVALIVLGVAMLLGYRPPISLPAIGVDGTRRTFGAMFLYGCAYAVASIGCAIGLFMATMFGTGRRDGAFAGLANGFAYGAGMTLVVMSLTIALALARTGLVSWLRSSTTHIEKAAAVFVIASGLYLLYYFWVVDVQNENDPITTRVDRIGSWLTERIANHWEVVALALSAVVAGAVAIVLTHRDRAGRSA